MCATPCIDGEHVYTFGRSGDLVCWLLLDGEAVWRNKAIASHHSDPYVIDGFLYGYWGFCAPCGEEASRQCWDRLRGKARHT